jgi:Amidohydrolase family
MAMTLLRTHIGPPLLLFAAAFPCLAQSASTTFTERFTVLSNSEKVGFLEARTTGNDVSIDYQVSNNGRGPKLAEQLTLGADGLPILWTIQGSTAFGGPAQERYSWSAGAAEWQSQADKGSVRIAKPKVYVTNDGSPWRYGLFVRALLTSTSRQLDVLPSGRMTLLDLGETSTAAGQMRAYALTGIELDPQLIWMDGQNRLFASALASGGSLDSLLIREGAEADAARILAAGRQLTLAQLEELQRRTAHRYDTPVRIRNVRVFDPVAGRLSAPVSVVVFRDRIASVASEPLEGSSGRGEVVIDGEGGTLIAGLHDMHSHNSAWSGVRYLAAGVTTTRDLGNDNSFLLDLLDRLEKGTVPGPHIVPAGLLEARSPYSARIGFVAATLDEALEDVRWYADHGYRQLKIYNSMKPEWVAPLAAEAHRLGMRVSGHVPAFMSPDQAVRDGYDEINHLNQLVLGWVLKTGEDTRTPLRLTALGERAHALDLKSDQVRATIELLKQRRTALDTTAVILERLMVSRAGHVSEADAPYLDHVPIAYQRYRKRSFVAFKSPAEDKAYVDSFKRLLDVTRLLHEQGIRLLPGTDDGTGFTVHRELELYVRAGIPPAVTLRIATLGCDEYLGRDQDRGSVAPGKIADVVLLDGDPLRDISAVRRARMVMRSGVVYFPTELYESMGIRPFTRIPTIIQPRE